MPGDREVLGSVCNVRSDPEQCYVVVHFRPLCALVLIEFAGSVSFIWTEPIHHGICSDKEVERHILV